MNHEPHRTARKMQSAEKKKVVVSQRLSKYIGAKAPRDKKLQAASMQAEFTLYDTLVMLCYLARDPDNEISGQARKNLIPAARSWYTRADRPELPEPVHEIIMKVIDRVGLGEKSEAEQTAGDTVRGNIGLLGLGEIIQAVDHNSRTSTILLERESERTSVYTENGKVVGAVCGNDDGMDVLLRAFGWVDADFTYMHKPPADFKNRIRVNTTKLVMDAFEYAPDEDPFDKEASRAWKVEGLLRVMNIFELAEIFEMNSKQCKCHLRREGEAEGFLFFKNGRIVNANLGSLVGMDAACHLLAWPNASFVITRGGEEIEELIHIGMQNLIIEAMRLVDEGVTVSDRIASELAAINELFEGKDVVSLPVLDKVRIVFGENEAAREALETDAHPVVRKALKVKISKTVHKYLKITTDHQKRLDAAQGRAPLSTSEKLVLLSYLSHDEHPEIKEAAKKTLESLDSPTFRKGLGADLHPSVLDFLIREAIRDETLIKIACGTANLLEETALYILDNWKGPDILHAMADNTKFLERSPAAAAKLAKSAQEYPEIKAKIETLEEKLLLGAGDLRIEGHLAFFGLAGLMRAARDGLRSGTVVVEGLRREGRVFFSKGKVTGATTGTSEGIAALREILSEQHPKFRYLLRTYFSAENLDPAEAEDLLNSPAAHPSLDPTQQTGLALVTGSPEVMDLYEVLSGLEGTPVPIRVTVNCEEGSGEIIRDRSRVIHVRVDGKENPIKSMAALLSWAGKTYVMRHAGGEIVHSIDKNLNDLFSEAMKEIPDELRQMTNPGELPEWELSEQEYESLYNQILNMGVAEKIKMAYTGNKEARGILVRDSNKMVAVAVVKSPKIQETEVEAIAKSRSVCDEVLRTISQTKEWMQSYTVKVNLVNNSKTPLPIAMKLIPHLLEGDLRRLAKSKNVAAAVATQARRLLDTR
ncbi:MAG: DUF4388 domain-containing protein [Thermodesulfobacteriota bacterium]